MAELKHIITADDSQFKKTLADVAKESAKASQKMASEANKAVESEVTKRKQLAASIRDQTKSIVQLRVNTEFYQAAAEKATNPAIIAQYNKKVQETQQEIQRLSNVGKKGFDSMGNAIQRTSGFTQALKANFTALLGALGFTTLLFELIALGKEMFSIQKKAEGVELAFAKIGDPTALAKLRTAVKGTVSDLELMQVAVRADNFSIPMDVLAKGLDFARQRAADTGQEVDYLVNSLVDGIGRKSTLVLDNLGISATELQAEFAKTGDFAQAVGNIIERAGGQGGIAIDTLNEKSNRFNATLQNMKRYAAGVFDDFFGSSQDVDPGNITAIVAKQQKVLEDFSKWEEDRQLQEIETRRKNAALLKKEYEAIDRDIQKWIESGSKAYNAKTGESLEGLRLKAAGLAEANAAEITIVEQLETAYKNLGVAQRQSTGVFTPAELKKKITDLQNAFDNTFDPEKQRELNAEIKKYEDILDRITGKEKSGERNRSLEQRQALLEKISAIEDEYSRKSLTRDEAEIQAVRDKFKTLKHEVSKFNEDPNNKVKIDASILQPTEDKAIADLIYAQETAALKVEIATRKELYKDFEDFRTQMGQEAANARYAGLIDLERTHLQQLQQDIAELENKEGRTGKEDERLAALKELADKEIATEREKYDKLLSGLLSFNQKKTALTEKHNRELALLGEDATQEQLDAADAKYQEALKALQNEFRNEYNEALAGINTKEDLARGLAEVSRFRIDKETELQRKLLDIAIKAARDRIEVLKAEQQALGIDNSDAIQAEEVFVQKNEQYLGRLQKNYITIGKELGSILASSSDDFVAKIGNMIGEVSGALGQFQSGGSDLEKAQGFVGLFIAIGKTLKQTFIDLENKEIETLKAMTQEVANRISFEQDLNKIYAERQRAENDNIFLGPDFSQTALNAVEESKAALKVFDDAMAAIFEGGVFSAEGKGKRNLFGTKKGTYDFSFQDILSQLMGVNVDLSDSSGLVEWLGNVLDPLSIFGQDAADRAEKDAFGKIQAAVSSALDAMGKSVEDFSNFSGQEMLDFFTLMEQGGYITDSATKQLIADGREAAEVMKEAEAAIKGVIESLSGDLGSGLRTALVDAFKAGEDAAKAFEGAVGSVLENIVSQMLFNEIFREDFEELQKQMEESLKGGDGDLSDDLLEFYKNAADGVVAYEKALEDAKAAAEAEGIEIFKGAGDKEEEKPGVLAGAIKGITADQADVLAGQFAGMRIAQLETLELARIRNNTLLSYSNMMTDQLAAMNLVAFNTGVTATNTNRMEQIEKSLISIDLKMSSQQNALEASGLG